MLLYVISILICEALLVSFAFYLIFSFFNKTPYYPSSLKQLEELKIADIIDFTKYKSFIDIGSGDGRIVRWAGKQGFQQSHGIDYNPYLTLYSRFRSATNSKIKIFNKNFHNHNYSQYDIVYMYIFSEHMDELATKLLSELKPGSVIITNTFKISTLEPDISFKKFSIYHRK